MTPVNRAPVSPTAGAVNNEDAISRLAPRGTSWTTRGSEAMAGVTLECVRKVYAGNVEAVKGVSLDIEDGSFCVLVGPSGCGKSTLLRMVAGLETISGGDGADRRARREPDRAGRARHRDGVPELRALPAHERLRQHGLRPAQPQHAEGRDRQARARGGAHPRHRALPRPQAARSSPAASASASPWAAPSCASRRCSSSTSRLSNLDAKLRVQMRVEIKRLQRALGVTSIYVTHDQVEAMTLSDKLVVMSGGQIEQVGTPVGRLPPPRDALRRDLHRLAAHEHPARQGRRAGPRLGRRPDDHGDRHARGPRRRHARSRSACGRRTCSAGTAGTSTLTMDVDFVEELGATQLFHGKVAGAEFVVQAPTGQIAADTRRLTLSIDPRQRAPLRPADRRSGLRLGPIRPSRHALARDAFGAGS